MERSRHLRAQGWLLQEIADEVKAGKGLVSLWVRGIDVPQDIGKAKKPRKERGISARLSCIEKGRAVWSEKKRQERECFREEGRVAARKGEALHAVGCSLYWGEGSKQRNVAQIINSDVCILRTFLDFCRVYFDIKNNEVSIRVSGYTDVYSEREMADYWIRELSLEGANEYRHDLDNRKYVSRGVNKNKVGRLPFGACTLNIRKSTRIVQHIYGALEVYGGVHLDPGR